MARHVAEIVDFMRKHHLRYLSVAAIFLIVTLFVLSCGNSGHGGEENRKHDVKQIYASGDEEVINSEVMEIDKELLLGKFDASVNPDFVLVDAKYGSRRGMYMRQDAYEAFMAMHSAAAADGVSLKVVSAWRSFDHQKRIWEDKWNGRQRLYGNIIATSIEGHVARAKEILRFSSMPGTSRHHWGTDIDINSLDNSYFLSGEGKRVYEWMLQNASGFGFCQPYTAHGQGRVSGYEEEKWHWSYKPVSAPYLEKYLKSVDIDDLTGFDGWQTAAKIGVIEKYVEDVNLSCIER